MIFSSCVQVFNLSAIILGLLNIYHIKPYLVGDVPTPLKNDGVSWDDGIPN